MEASQPSRVVVVSSLSHIFDAPANGIHYDELNNAETYSPSYRYGETKLANLHFAKELQERLLVKAMKDGKECKIYVNSVHPGVVYTEIGRNLPSLFHMVAPYLLISSYKGALTQLYAATAEKIETDVLQNKYFVPFCTLAEPSPNAQNKELALKTWYWTEKNLRDKFKKDWKWCL